MNSRETSRQLSEIRRLLKVVPVCAYCGRVRGDDGAWYRVKDDLNRLPPKTLSHGICGRCVKLHHPEEEIEPE